MGFSNDEIFQQWQVSGLSIRAFHARYYSEIDFEAFRHRMKRVKQKQAKINRDGEQYDRPAYEKAFGSISDNFIKIALMSDIHFLDENKRAVELGYKIIEDFKPHIVPVGNDEFTIPRYSRHIEDPRNIIVKGKDDLKHIEPYHQLHVMSIRQAAPDALIPFYYGNHDHWWADRCLEKMPEAIHTMDEAWTKMIRAGGLVYYLGDTDKIDFHRLTIQHISGGGDRPALANAKKYSFQRSVIASHIHRVDELYINGPEFSMGSVTTGCLCNDPPYYQRYIKRPTKWVLGITLVEYDQYNTHRAPQIYSVRFHPHNNKLVARIFGKEFIA